MFAGRDDSTEKSEDSPQPVPWPSGRTGCALTVLRIDHWQVTPDIITVAKGISGGYSPLDAAILRQINILLDALLNIHLCINQVAPQG